MIDADLILLGHGSRRGIDTDEGLREVVTRLQQRVPPTVRVRLAGFEFTRPNLSEAISGLVAEGSRSILVAPYFLFDGKHITLEIPEELEALNRRYPRVNIVYAPTLGVDARLIEVVMERLHEAVLDGSCAGAPCRCFSTDGTLGIIFVSRGSHPEFDNGERLRQLAALLEERLGGSAPVAHAQAQYASPTIAEAAQCLVTASAETIIVVPYIFFPGKVLYDNILPGVEAVSRNYPDRRFKVAATLGVDDRLIDVVLERAQDALDQGRSVPIGATSRNAPACR